MLRTFSDVQTPEHPGLGTSTIIVCSGLLRSATTRCRSWSLCPFQPTMTARMRKVVSSVGAMRESLGRRCGMASDPSAPIVVGTGADRTFRRSRSESVFTAHRSLPQRTQACA